MTGPFHAWRDTLQDLGVLGLIPIPVVPAAAPSGHDNTIARQLTSDNDYEKISMRPPAPVPMPEPLPVRAQAPQPVARPIRVQPAAVPQPSPEDPVAFPRAAAVAAADTLAGLERLIQGCLACPLGCQRLRFVFGEGSAKARMLFIGEGPGRDEDLQGRPFVGKAGELLDKMLAAVELDRANVYIANIVKCRPPDNRTPSGEEAQRCLPYLRRQIELLKPAVIVTLGATPLRELLGLTQGITQIRGQWQTLDLLGGIPVLPTFHPAYVLRQYTQEVRRAVWSDLLSAKKWLETHP